MFMEYIYIYMEYYGICIYIYVQHKQENMIQPKILKNSEWKFPKQQTFTPCNPVQQSAKLTNNLQHMKICKEITHPILRQSVVPTSTCQRLGIKGCCQFWKQWILWTFKAQFYSFTEKKAHDTVQNYFSVVYIFSFLFYLGNQAWLAGKSTICRWCSQLLSLMYIHL